ncbi:MAG: hypothetical protein RL563_1818 [Pseudomonadota bacterium]
MLKILCMTVLHNDNLYMMVSELEVNRGYVDLALILHHDARKYQALDFLLEFKYVDLKELGLSGEQVQALAADQLAALPLVTAKLEEASEQARRYGADLRARYPLADLRCAALVNVGLQRVVWRAVPDP